MPASPPTPPPAAAMAQMPRVVAHVNELLPDERWCTCCRRPLKGKVAWLELDQRTDTYHDFGGVPEDKSQGWFPFGLTCARAALALASAGGAG